MRWYRKLQDYIFTVICSLFCLVLLSVLVSILWTLISHGIQGLNLSLFTEMTPAPGSSGGLANAIFGSVVITAIGAVLAAPIGILAATYLAEYGQDSKLAQLIRLLNDTLLSAPSIIIGLFVYAILVQTLGHFSAVAGSVALGLIALPMIIRGVEDVLVLLPEQLREAAIALGVPRWRVTVMIIYRAAKQGIFTIILLAIARMLGETAPLLFTTLSNQFWSADITQPMANLPVVIYQYAMSPYSDWQQLAWSGALLITFIVIAMSLITRFVLTRKGA
ncbi:phosphate ABC transporter permease PstA [Piscirickettsia litoralis]|uniref:Phosphate transport system permease protein PstA n=1 Tax=Piscirickettsia litoralis TaxID=1891921 RepID=A0ABX3A5Q0_9GAMM|nr:phosphate ABC transporter permease PstA [Piscirickettsia litoralis]ODN43552.1 phosphate ABC transporter, permease protein PstA [Piscirickettsia litoralis]